MPGHITLLSFKIAPIFQLIIIFLRLLLKHFVAPFPPTWHTFLLVFHYRAKWSVAKVISNFSLNAFYADDFLYFAAAVCSFPACCFSFNNECLQGSYRYVFSFFEFRVTSFRWWMRLDILMISEKKNV